jgi:predicted esterase/photosystem II stability/assembly factor-like uncharacterized protein
MKRVLVIAVLGAAACGGGAGGAAVDGGGDDSGGGDDGGCTAECLAGATRCGVGGLETCAPIGGCARWGAAVACPGGAPCADGACTPCTGGPGELRDQALTVAGETRHYWLYVPAAYACTAAWPLLVDLHGTASGTEADEPETYYALPELIAVAEQEGFIVARPRSRSAMIGGAQIYQWDVNAGDLARNAQLGHRVVAAVAAAYHVDPARTYVAGFSNGTNMAAQFLADDPPVFAGIATIAGGLWAAPAADLDASSPRVYTTTGYRDYMFDYQRDLLAFLEGHGLPAERVFVRESDTGHELYGWHYRELFRWLDRGERPAAGGWAQVGAIGGGFPPNLSGVCLLPSGAGVAVGEGALVTTADGGATWARQAAVPALGSTWFPYAYLNFVACHATRVVGGGYTVAAVSDDGGATWAAASMITLDGYPAQAAGVAVSEAGTWLATGYWNYVGRSTDGHTFTAVATPEMRQWWTEAAAAPGGRWVVVGEGGTILVSTDDGVSFAVASSPTQEDLYAVAFADATRAVAVGAHGTALLTSDGGATWADVSSGLDGYLGDVTWLSPGRALVVGEGGAVLTYEP